MRIGIPVAAALLGLLIGLGIGLLVQRSSVDEAESRAAAHGERSEELEQQLAESEALVAEQAEIIDFLSTELEQVTAERDDLQPRLDSTLDDLDEKDRQIEFERERADQLAHDLERVDERTAALEEIADALWDDLRLLIELNRTFPDDEDEFAEYVERLAQLTIRTYPEFQDEAESMVAALPGYLAWQESLTEQEILVLFEINRGSREFSSAYRALERAVIRAVIERLEFVTDHL